MDITLKPSEAASLMDCTVRAIRKRIALGKLDAVTIINKDNRPQYQIAISSLPPSAQEKYYARQRAELAAPADASSAPTAKALKPFDCYTEAEREEIVFWKRVLADWEKYRQRGGMNAAELDKRFLAYLALEYPDRKLSIATLYRKRKALAEGDLDGLVDGRGKGRKGKRSMPEPVWTFFRGALLQETKHMDIREAMRRTEEHFQLTDPDMLSISERVFTSIRLAHMRGSIVAVVGDSGIGKTKAALEYNSVYPSSSYYLEATPVNGNLRSFLRALSAEMGLPDGGSNLDLENRIKEHLLGMNKVLIIDEAQNLKFTTMEMLKSWSDGDQRKGLKGAGLALIGNPDIESQMQSPKYDRHRNRRVHVEKCWRNSITKDDVLRTCSCLSWPRWKSLFLRGQRKARV